MPKSNSPSSDFPNIHFPKFQLALGHLTSCPETPWWPSDHEEANHTALPRWETSPVNPPWISYASPWQRRSSFPASAPLRRPAPMAGISKACCIRSVHGTCNHILIQFLDSRASICSLLLLLIVPVIEFGYNSNFLFLFFFVKRHKLI